MYFGNIQGYTYISHWQISFSGKKISADANELLNKIVAEFEFDRADMITVTFQCLKRKRINYQTIVSNPLQ